ncbi:hypothetical protein BDW75DRAFT_185747 [Aspergillus navahoensis]
MDLTSKHGWSDPRGAERKGSVRRAREMLEVGKRPRIRVPQENATVPAGPHMSQQTAWPLLGDNDGTRANVVDPRGRLSNMVDSQGRLMAPGAPPPPHPPQQDPPSPSVYSERSVPEAVPSPLHLNNRNRGPSFSKPFVNQQHIHPALREPIPTANEDTFRKSAASSVGSIPSIPDFPLPLPSQDKTGSLIPLAPIRSGINRRSSVSPIPEELPDSPTILNKPYTRLTASSWNSEQQESEILGVYMDNNSEGAPESPQHVELSLVRQASVGTRGKPSLRTISKPSANGLVDGSGRTETPIGQTNDDSLKEVAVGLATRDSFSSSSSEESDIDPEKPPIVLGDDASAQHPYDNNNIWSVEKEAAPLPQRAPTMSEMRPGARRPPQLNINAVREAEARGSLTSLSDLIKRATKLATNLEHGRTASRNDLLNVGGSRHPFGDPNRRSGSIKDILASFPNPAATPEGRSSWPIFWRRSTLHQLNSHEQGQEGGQEKGSTQSQRRRCCGMPLWVFITACVVLILVIAAAVLLPIFLVVVPRENKGNDSGNTVCEKTTPCSNDGVSVSSGDICSCVCVNGYTGSRCTMSGDASCVTTEITQDSTSRNATVGDDLPRLFQDSQSNFSIPLDSVTIMALFSQNNVSCTTENALVSFKGLSSNDNKRRAFIADHIVADTDDPEPSSPTDEPSTTLPVRRDVATKNGILFEDTGTDKSPAAAETSSASTSNAPPAPTSTVTAEALDFSRIAVLYILEKTGTLDAAIFSADVIQRHLEYSFSNSSDENFVIKIVPSGVKGNITLDYGGFTITDFDGNTVGAS